MTTIATITGNKRLLATILKGLNAADLSVLDGHPGFWETRQVVPPALQAFTDWVEVFPTCQVAEGDLVFSYGASLMTHRGDFAGLAPTGRRVVLELFSLDQVIDGTVVEHNSITSWATVFRQLDVPGFAAWPARTAEALAPPQPATTGASEAKAIVARLLTSLVAGAAAPVSEHPAATTLGGELAAIRAAFPDLRITIVSQLAEGDLVATRATLRGSHQQTLWGLAPTGRALTWDHFSLARLSAGRVIEARGSADWNAGLAQLGRFPPS